MQQKLLIDWGVILMTQRLKETVPVELFNWMTKKIYVYVFLPSKTSL